MKKKEILFIAGILVFSLILWAVTAYFRRGTCNFIRITVNGEEYGTYSLAEDREISVNGTNVCEIRNGRAKMTKADCPDHLCMRQSAIGDQGGTIVCLPNRVVIEGVSDEEPETVSSEFDTVV